MTAEEWLYDRLVRQNAILLPIAGECYGTRLRLAGRARLEVPDRLDGIAVCEQLVPSEWGGYLSGSQRTPCAS